MRSLTIVVTALALLLAPAAGAQAQDATISASLMPNAPGVGSTLHVGAEGAAPELSGAIPQSVVLDVQRGFAVDLVAVAVRCAGPALTSGACPAASRIGAGKAVAHASGLLTRDIEATIDLFLAAPAQAGDLASVVVRVTAAGAPRMVRARLLKLASGPFGYELRLDGFAGTVPAVPGVALTLRYLTLDVGARRRVTTTVVRRVRVTRRGKRVTVRRKVRRSVRHDLIRNPTTCAGGWAVRATVRVADTDRVRDVAVPCAPVA